MKNRLLLSFLVSTFLLTTLYADITTGLVAYYEFENNTSDSSVGGYNLELNSTGTNAYEVGKLGVAYTFNGTDNYLSVSGLPPSTVGTMAFWVKGTSPQVVFDTLIASTGTDVVSIYTNNNFSQISIGDGSAGYDTFPTDINNSTWHHVVATFDGLNSSQTYFDGNLISGTHNNETPGFGENLHIGWGGAGNHFTGSMDDVRIYNRVLTSTDVTELYNYDTTPKLTLKAHGGVVQFGGKVGDQINLGDISALNNSSAFTIEMWLKNDDQISNPYLFNKFTDWNNRISLLLSGNKLAFSVSNGANQYTYATESLVLHEWNHVAFVFDGNGTTLNDAFKMYVDGNLQTNTGSSGTFPTTTANLTGVNTYIGSVLNDGNVSMDDFRVWSVARTQFEIQASMNHQLEGNETGLVAYYNFDERVGNNVVDVAGGDSNGTIEGNVSRLNFLGDGLNFNGLDNNITLSDANFPTGSSAYAISAWIYPSATGNLGILSWGTLGITNAAVGLTLTSTGIKNYWWGNDLYVGTGDLSNSWHHVVAQYDGTTRSIWLDGNLIGSEVVSGLNIVNSIAYIGVSDPIQNDFFSGKISEVSIWDKALTQNDINKTMHSSLRGNEAGLVGYWPLNEGTGLITYDRSLNTNDGTIAGATWIDSAPKILGDKLYTTGKLTTFNKLTLENNITIPTYTWDGAIPSSIDFNSAFGTFAHTATDINESFAISANNDYNVTVRTINYPNIAFVYLNLNLSNVLLTDHNITNIQVIGEDGNTENFSILDVANIIDGANSYTVPIFNPDNNFSIKIDVNDVSFSQSYYYNFVDKHLYGSQDYNLSSDFKQEISLINSNFTIDANLSNYIADLDFHVDFNGSTTALAYSTLQGWISGNTKQFIENLPQQIATSIGTLAYDFNTTVKQYYKDQLVTLRLASSIGANNSVIETTLLQEYDASHNIGPTTVTANLIDLNVSINEIGPISNILLYDPNGYLQAHVMLQEEFNTSSINFNIPVISGDYSIQAVYRDGNVSSYDNITDQWIDSSIANPVFTISTDLILPVLDSNFNSLLIATTPPLSSFYAQNIYLIKNFEDLNLTFSVYDINGSDINISVEYNSSIIDINTSFSPLSYVSQADYDTSYLTVKSIADVVGTTPVKVTFTNANLLNTFIEFNVTVAPYGTKVNAGWNLLSLPVSIDLNKTALKDTFAHNIYIERLYKYNGRWSYWDSVAGYDTSINKFSSLRSTEGFWLNSMADTNVVYNFEANLTDINSSLNVYHSGWYLMGFNRDCNITDIPIIVAENNITGIDSVDYVYRYEYLDYSPHWEVYSPDTDLLQSVDSIIERTEDNISRYDGVWVYVRKVF